MACEVASPAPAESEESLIALTSHFAQVISFSYSGNNCDRNLLRNSTYCMVWCGTGAVPTQTDNIGRCGPQRGKCV